MNRIFVCNLQLFADGGDGVSVGVAEGSAADNVATEGQVAADTQVATDTAQADAEREANYKSMIASPEYKDIHNKYFEKAMGRRLKGKEKQIAELQGYKDQTATLLDRLAVKYGVADPTDIEAILKASDEDDSFYEQYAYEHNIGVPEAKQVIKAQRVIAENDRKLAQEAEQQAFIEHFNNVWLPQAAETQQYYPDFDFDYETSDECPTSETFNRLINNGVTVKMAYEVIHQKELMGGAMQFAYNAAQQEMADARTARTQRPKENGTSGQQASAVVDDMSKLSKADRQKIRAAVSRGEKVTPDNFRNYLN